MTRALALAAVITLGCAHTNRSFVITDAQIIDYLRDTASEYDTFWKHEFIRNINKSDVEDLQRWYDADRAFETIMNKVEAALRAKDLGMAVDYLGKAASLMSAMGVPVPQVKPPWEK